MSEYVPTRQEIIKGEVNDRNGRRWDWLTEAEIERGISAIEREAAAKALAEFAVEIERCDMPERGVHINMTQYREGLISGVSRAMRAASRRAAEIRERTNDDG